ncbi:MauE/DoxX family redox-associated membrane protein [uncultured Dietzia sp.]|uniref:MauE/DoxX family redox-associated membrane protein n=1 Tax=uncultured Dietzia sp. TaxID=395519 RepID=UPI0026167955|nr:MauE/DoxX family redox-associated membrane protein [uncultured Dietzia sp.]
MTGMFITSVVGIALLTAGVSKLRDLDAHARVVMGYKLLPDPVARRLGRALPFIEIALGVATIGRLGLPVTAWAAAALFAGYAVGLAVNLARGRTDLDCGCFAFGTHDAPRITWWHAARALGFAAAAALTVVLPGPDSVAEVATGVATGALAVVLGFGVAAVASTLSLGRRRVDDYLAPARAEMRRRQGARV